MAFRGRRVWAHFSDVAFLVILAIAIVVGFVALYCYGVLLNKDLRLIFGGAHIVELILNACGFEAGADNEEEQCHPPEV